jgi:hypothetical protein
MPCVSILFVDVCQFTVLSSVLEPIQIVVLLNELFSGAQLPPHIPAACADAKHTQPSTR